MNERKASQKECETDCSDGERNAGAGRLVAKTARWEVQDEACVESRESSTPDMPRSARERAMQSPAWGC